MGRENAHMKRRHLKIALRTAAGVLLGAGACYFLLLCLADMSGERTFRVTSEYTGYFLCPYSALTFAAAFVAAIEKKAGGALLAVLPHAVLIMSLLVETMTVTNFFNHAMELLTSPLSKCVIIIYAVLSLELAVTVAFGDGKKE